MTLRKSLSTHTIFLLVISPSKFNETLKILGVTLWSGIGVKIKVSFYFAVLLFYVVVYAFTHAAFALFVAHFSIKDVNIAFFFSI